MDSQRRLYGDAAEIEKQLAHMQLMETAAGGLASVHKDKNTGAFWLNCYATTSFQGGGYQMLIRLPLPGTKELIEIAIHSKYKDEAIAAILRLLDEEAIEGKNFRLELLSKIEEWLKPDLPEGQKERLNLILKFAALTDATNRREIVGKTKEEVAKDALYFEQASQKANALLEQLRP